MKILILNWRDVDHPKSGGAEIVTMKHAQGWVQRGWNVTWFTSYYPGVKRKERVLGIDMIRKGGGVTVYLWGFLYVLFRSTSYDVIVDEIHALPFLAPLVSRRPVVGFIHEVAGEIWKFMVPFPLSALGIFLEKCYLPMYKKTYFWLDAPSTVQELEKYGIDKKNCTAIPCPIASFPPKRNFSKEKHLTVVFVSRVVEMKGVEEVIKAMSLLLQEEPNAQLWIVGGGEERYLEKLRQMIIDLGLEGSTTLWGKVEEEKKFELMSRAHLILHASVKEGWGLVILEAAACNTPAVVYNVAGLVDVVKDGATGIVLKHNTPHELATETIKLYRDKKKYTRFQRNGRTWVFSLKWDTVIDQSQALLKKAISHSI